MELARRKLRSRPGGPSVRDAEKDGIAEKRQHSAHIVTAPKPRSTSLAPVLVQILSY
jgi:hypothetical protein